MTTRENGKSESLVPSGNGQANLAKLILSGHVEVDELGTKKKVKCVMFSNKDKSNERAPDYRVYVSKEMNGEGGNKQAAPSANQGNEVVDEQVL